MLRTIVAFANTAGGILLVGVDDKTGNVVGVSDPLDLEERLASLISDSIAPHLVPEIEILPWRRAHLLAVQVFPSANRPHFLKRKGLEEGTYVRVGSTNRRADRPLIEAMRRFANSESYDEQAMPDLSSEDLDFRAASELFAPIHRLKQGDLESLRLITFHQGRRVPTVGGILLFGRNRERYFPDAWIQAGRFEGTDKTRIADQAEIKRHLPHAVEAAVAFVNKHMLHAMEIGSVHQISGVRPLFLILLRLVNAFRDDTDGREVQSQEITHFFKRVVMNSHRLMNPLIAGCLICNVREQIFQARSSGKALSFSNLWVNSFLRE